MFHVVALKNCPYSEEAVALFSEKGIPHKVTWVDHETKHKYKEIHPTFPQISFNVITPSRVRSSVFIGGLGEFKNLLEISDLIKNKNFSSQIVAPLLVLLK